MACAVFVGAKGCASTPYDLAAEVAKLRDLDTAADVCGEILAAIGVKPETQRAGGLLLAGLLIAHLPEFKLPMQREKV
jgi:hypothetical protein